MLLMKTLAHIPLPTVSTSCSSSQLPLLACTLLATAALASACAPPSLAQDLHTSTSSIAPLFDLSEGQQEFWGNVARYGRYFVTVMLGTGYVMLRPFTNLFTKNPASALLAVGLLVGAVVGTKFTLELMLGMQSGLEYNAGNF